MWRVLELGLISLWMRRLSERLLSQPRDGQKVLPVYGKPCNLDPTGDHKYEKDINKSGKVPKTGVDQAEDCLAGWGLEQEMCKQGEEGSDHSHPPATGSWGDSGVQLFWGSTRKAKEAKFRGCSKGSSNSSTREWKSTGTRV